MLVQEQDYAARFAEWNTNGHEAIRMLEAMRPQDTERQLLAVDWRDQQAVEQQALPFIGYVGLQMTEAGLPLYDGTPVNIHKTTKGKLFFDYVTTLESGLQIIERRIALPTERMAVTSLFRATRKKVLGHTAN